MPLPLIPSHICHCRQKFGEDYACRWRRPLLVANGMECSPDFRPELALIVVVSTSIRWFTLSPVMEVEVPQQLGMDASS